jgi:hypothetical protein
MVSEYKNEATRVITAPSGGEVVPRITRMIMPDQETVYHVQTRNKGNFLSLEFGLKAFNARSRKERLRRYRRFVYEAAVLKRSRGKSCIMIDEKIIAKESKTDIKNTRAYKFRYRTRYFSDSGIIGSKAFVSRKYQQFKDIFHSKHEKKPKPVKGLDGIYSLKRLSKS